MNFPLATYSIHSVGKMTKVSSSIWKKEDTSNTVITAIYFRAFSFSLNLLPEKFSHIYYTS